MGKKKKKRSVEGGDAVQYACDVQRDVPDGLLEALGDPLTSAILQEGDSGHPSRILMSPDTMHEARIATGTLICMSLTSKDIVQAKTSSSFAPSIAKSSSLEKLVPRNLCDVLGVHSKASNECEDGSLKIGEYVLCVEVWPGVKLAKGSIQLSGPLLQNFGFPKPGSTFLVYPLSCLNTHQATNLEIDVGVNRVQPPCFCSTLHLALARNELGNGNDEIVVLSSSSTVSGKAPKEVGESRLDSLSKDGKEDWNAKQIEWLKGAVSGAGSRQQRLLEKIALRQLDGRYVAQGNLLPITVLGCSVVCMVESALIDGENRIACWNACGVDMAKTSVSMVFSSDGVGEDSSNLGIVGKDLVGMAHEVATKNVEGSSKEAAGEAAKRAAMLGRTIISKSKFESLGGVSQYVRSLRSLVTLPLTNPGLFTEYGIRPPRGIILYGPPGTGKTMLACAAAKDANANMFVINGPDILSEFYGGSEAGLTGVFTAARALGPSVVFIDEIDALVPSRGGATGSSASSGGVGAFNRLVTTLLTLLDGISPGDGDKVVVIAATNRLDSIDPALRRPGRFDREIEVRVPSPSDRVEILKSRMSVISHNLGEEDVRHLALNAHGFVAADLAALCREAALGALRRVVRSEVDGSSPGEVTLEDFVVAQNVVRPSGIREISVQVPKVKWEDVGGVESIKQQLKEAVEWPLRHGRSLDRVGAKPPKGVLLYGPPGCSKTLLAKAVATETGMNFLSVKGSELLSTYVGESEKAVSLLFSRARQVVPCIVFFDEIDGLAVNREGDAEDSTGVGGRVLTQLLTELDGVQSRGEVVVIAATNKPYALDPALLRPGRFDRLVYVPPPDSSGREAVFRVCLKRMSVGEDVDFGSLAAQSPGFTGADIAACCREAGILALEEDINASVVSMSHLESALEVVGPSSPGGFDELMVFAKFRREAVV